MSEESRNSGRNSPDILLLVGGVILIIASFLITQFFILDEKDSFFPDLSKKAKSFLASGKDRLTGTVDQNIDSGVETSETTSGSESSGEKGEDTEKKDLSNASLQIEILEYPEVVEDICQEFIIKMKVKNVGDSALAYEDIEAEDYFIDLVCEELEEERPFINTLTKEGGTTITNFGVLKPGDETVINYSAVDKIEAVDDEGNKETMFENPFNNVEENGTYTLRIDWGTYDEKDQDVIIGRSDSFTVQVEALVSPGLFKACHE